MKVDGTVTVKKLNIDAGSVAGAASNAAAASIGEDTLPAGDTKVVINTSSVTDKSRIFVTATTKTALPLSVTKQTDGDSFTVEIAAPASGDVKFNWWIIN